MKHKKSSLKRVHYLLEQGTIESMNKAKARTEALLKYYWNYHHELEYQRQQISNKLSNILNAGSTPNFIFDQWQRVVKYKHSLNPLSAVGSLSDPGGRFNIGNINPQSFLSFPALYIARDKETAIQETLLGMIFNNQAKLSATELALTAPDSITIVSVTGKLDKILDVRSANQLRKFVNCVKHFTLTQKITDTAKYLGIEEPEIISRPKQMHDALLDKNWRYSPMHFDIPSVPQIFGQLVHHAGIEGILYPSRLTGNDCIAIFTRNFDKTTSYIELTDSAPDEVLTRRIDASNWHNAEFRPTEYPTPKTIN